MSVQSWQCDLQRKNAKHNVVDRCQPCAPSAFGIGLLEQLPILGTNRGC